jgi:hypothetical protein
VIPGRLAAVLLALIADCATGFCGTTMMSVMVFLAALTSEQLAFYSTAATVIPVLVLGSILAVATFARGTSRWLESLGAAILTQSRKQRSDLLQEVRASAAAMRVLKPLLDVQLFLIKFLLIGVGRRFVAYLLLLGFLLPTAGEVVALAALASGHAGAGSEHTVWVGLGVSAVLALVPVLEVVVLLILPVDTLRKLLEKAALLPNDVSLSTDSKQRRDAPAAELTETE